MKTSIRVTVHSPTKGTHEEEFNIIQFPSGEIGGHFSQEFVDFTAYAASSINNVIMIVKGYDKDTLFAVALDEFKESFYNPNKQMLESNFAVSTSIVHDRSFILYKNMRGESCKHIG